MALVESGKAVQGQIASAAAAATLRALPDLDVLSPDEAGGAMRAVATGVLNQFENLAQVAGAEQFLRYADAATGFDPNVNPLLRSRLRTAEQIAFDERRKQLEIAWREAELARPKRVDAAVGRGMKAFTEGRTLEAGNGLAGTLSRNVANAFRDTVTAAANGDPRVSGYQRVASPLACAFCLTVALNTYTTFEDAGGYHDDCGCTTVPVFTGDSPVRPEYYGEFDEIYQQGFSRANSSDPEAIFAAIREVSGRS